ncbi:MAG: hypothetical protein PHY62_08135 [Gallionella sp.]|nr:hypothetical protein [Gallionella sp.]
MINYSRAIGHHHQHGAALMVMLIVLVLGVAATLVGSLNSAALKNDYQKANELALAQAKEALIGYALTYADSHLGKTFGYLPCPDRDGNAGGSDEGSSSTCSGTGSDIGRLPWRTLHLPTLRDGNGECLWYAVSGSYKNNTTASMNWDNKGQLKMYSGNGVEVAPDEVVALVISPGARTANNSSREGNNAPTCGGNYDTAAYLDNDTEHMINNAAISSAKFILPHEHRDTNGSVTLTTNDQFLTITRQDIWAGVQARIAKEATQCLDNYAQHAGNKYPWAVPLNDTSYYTGRVSSLFGRIPSFPAIYTDNSNNLIELTFAIYSLQVRLNQLQLALENFKESSSETNKGLLSSAGRDTKVAGENLSALANSPSNPITSDIANKTNSAGEKGKEAGNKAQELAETPPDAITSETQTKINEASSKLNQVLSELSSENLIDGDMNIIWPNCSLFSSNAWLHWRNYIFYQVASGYKPGSSSKCGNSCLSAQRSNSAMTGSGTYRAVVIGSGKSLSNTTRVTNNLSDYLEADNRLPQNDNTKTYKTYRSSDGEFSTNNDLVLCLNGSPQCSQ